MSPIAVSTYCSPHPSALQIDSPSGSGDFAFMIPRTGELLYGIWHETRFCDCLKIIYTLRCQSIRMDMENRWINQTATRRLMTKNKITLSQLEKAF